MSRLAKWVSVVFIGAMVVGMPSTYADSAASVKSAANVPKAKVANVRGEWVPPDGDAVIRIEYCGDASSKLCAELTQHAYGALSNKDSLNPDAALRERPLIGVHILEGLKMTGVKSWKGGQLYDPRTGKSYHAKVKLLSNSEVKITGCIGPGLCKGYVWKRARPDLKLVPGSLAEISNANVSSLGGNAPNTLSKTSG